MHKSLWGAAWAVVCESESARLLAYTYLSPRFRARASDTPIDQARGRRVSRCYCNNNIIINTINSITTVVVVVMIIIIFYVNG